MESDIRNLKPTVLNAAVRGLLFGLIIFLLGERDILRIAFVALLFAVVAYTVDYAIYTFRNRKKEK